MAPEYLGPLLDRFVKRQILERVQRIVMDEDCDRPLCGQQVRGAPDHRFKTTRTCSLIPASLGHTSVGYGGFHESNGLT